MIYDSILDTIGNTPVVKLNHISPKKQTVFVKVESFNPMASVKDRLATAIIDAAEINVEIPVLQFPLWLAFAGSPNEIFEEDELI